MAIKDYKIIILTILTVAAGLALVGTESRLSLAQAPQADPQKGSPGAAGQPSEPSSMPGMDMGQGSPTAKTETKIEISTGGNVIPAGSSDAVRFTGQEWSEFNHRGAGWFLFFWGLTALLAGLQWPRKTWWRLAPGVVLLGLVEFLFIRNDPESWPTGSIGLWDSLRDPEVFQHRVFVILLILIAVVELLRAGDKLTPFFARYALPILASLGGIYLFFHKHGGAAMQKMAQQMANPAVASSPAMQSMMAAMATIKHEHLWFSILGFGLAGAKLLADLGKLKGRLGATLWTLFAIVLGIYMMGYVE
ncbi:MAG TPA: hypothetical protein VG028_02965 [Terriglobia bacterium]|nr:hypothetical protein [Terriglobia bacterium]